MKKVAEKARKEIEVDRRSLNYNEDGKLYLPRKNIANR